MSATPYRGFWIDDWDWWHDGYDGPGDTRLGNGSSKVTPEEWQAWLDGQPSREGS